MGIVSDMTDVSPTPSPSAPAKAGVLEELGHESLVLPTLVNRGLVANDRAKYLLSLLQAARSHADAPSGPCSSLRAERLAAGVADAQLDSVVDAVEPGWWGRRAVPHPGRRRGSTSNWRTRSARCSRRCAPPTSTGRPTLTGSTSAGSTRS